MRLLLLILIFTPALHAAPDASSCRDAIVRLIGHLALDRQAMKADDLEALAAEEKPTSPIPFTDGLKETEKHSFGKAFARAARGLGDGWNEVRRAIREEILPTLTRGKKARETAEKETKVVIYPVVISPLSVRANPTQGVTPISRILTWKGRRYLSYQGAGDTFVMLDMETLEPRQYRAGRSSAGTPPSYFEKDGVGYAVMHGYAVNALNLDTGDFSELNPTYSTRSVVVGTGKKPIVVISSKEGDTGDKDGLVFHWPVGTKKSERLPIRGGSGQPIAVGEVEGRTLLATQSKDGKYVAVVDAATRRKVFPEIPIKGVGYSDYTPEFFQSAKGPRLLVPADGHFVIIDPTTGTKSTSRIKMVEPLAENKPVAIYEEKGKKRAVYVGETQLGVIDLETGKSLTSFGSSEKITSPPAVFEYDGHHYVTWAVERGKIYIAEPASGSVWEGAKVAPGMIREIIPFVKDGRVEAVILPRVSGHSPVHVQLIGPPQMD